MKQMDKVYERTNWENEPSVSSPLNATNLNKIDYAVDELDNRVISLDTTKISKAETASDIVNVSLDEDTGIFTFTRRDNSTVQLDTKLEKITTNWTYDIETECLVLTLDDGTTQTVDLSKLITVYEFMDSDTISFSINSTGKVVASVKNGSITDEQLETEYLADIKVEAAKASSASASASGSATASSASAQEAKNYAEQAKQYRDEAETFTPDGYTELQETVASNTAKIDTIIEKAELNIKNSASGENIHLTDSANGKNVAFGLYGKAEQKQYSGKNLLENTATTTTSNGVTFTVNEDKSVTINGTNNGTQASTFNIHLNLVDGVTYIASGIKGGSIDTYQVYLQKSDGTMTSLGHMLNKEATFTKDSDEYNVAIYRIRVSVGATVNNVTIYPMIRLASITDSTYEPYVGGIASPNPDYPQDIEVSGSDGSVEVVSCGKNLLNQESFRLTNDETNRTKNLEFNLLPDRYYFSCKWQGTASSVGVQIYNEKWQILSTTLTSGEPIEFYSESLNISRIYMFVPSGDSSGNYADITDIMIMKKESGVDTSYQPYTETVSTIPTPDGLCGIKVSSGGNYTDENGQQWVCDEIVKYADGRGEYIQRIKKHTFGESDSFSFSSGSLRIIFNSLQTEINKPLNNGIKGNIVCNRYGTATANITMSVENTIAVDNNGIIYIKDSVNGTSADLFKAYISSNETYLYYELAEPITTPLTAEEIAEIEKLHTFYPITNISNDADCGMSITYMADAKNYIDNRLALIESAMLNNI